MKPARISEVEFDQQYAARGQDEWTQGNGGDNYVAAVKVEPRRTDMMVCWNCKDIGHLFTQCQQPSRGIFCYSCGQAGVVKSDCSKCAMNFRRDAMTAGTTRPGPTNRPQILQRPAQAPQQGRMNPFTGAARRQ